MSDRRLLYFTASEHYIYRWRGGRLELEASFAADEVGVGEFRSFAKGTGGSLYYVVADLTGEDFHEETIPWLRASDRENVLQRRLAQRYRDTRLAAVISLGSIRGERRNERVLLASFTNTQQFSPWLDALAETGAKLAGVYSVPLLAPAIAARLAGKLGAQGTRFFVVSMNRAGLRQSFVEDGRLRFARLESINEMAPEALAALLRSETLRLAQFLGSLRVLPRDGAPVTAIVVAPDGQRAVFEQALPSDARLAFRVIELAEAARRLGVKRAEGLQAEQLYLHLAVKRPPKDQFARREDRRGFLVWRLQRGIVAAGAIGFAACSAYAGVKWIDLAKVRNQGEIQAFQAKDAEQEYQRITASFPVTLTTTENLRATVNEFVALAARSASPEQSFLHLSKVLDQFPQIELDQLAWRVGGPAGARAQAPASAAPPPPAGKPAASSGPANVQALDIEGHVNATERSDYRAITALVQRFSEALSADPAYSVVRTKLPFDLTSEGTLSGDIGGAAGDVPRFTLSLERRGGQ